MYKCRKCGLKFKTQTEWKDHEFDCVNYVQQQTNELEKARECLKNRTTEFDYNIETDEYRDLEDILHKSIHFNLHIQFINGSTMDFSDKTDPLKSGYLTSYEDIIKYIHNELYGSKELTAYEKAMIEFYSAS